MNNIDEVIKKCNSIDNRFVGDLNLLTLAAFDCKLNEVSEFTAYSDKQVESFKKYLSLFWETDIPPAYIVGFEYFLGYKITVTKHTLIPRFETEELVINLEQSIRSKYQRGAELSICDICCGSGVIGVSLFNRLCNDYNVKITFTDISTNALFVTKINAINYKVDYSLIEGDMSKPIVEKNLKFDIIVSNPPYIGYDQFVQPQVLKYEPKLALYAEEDGLVLYKKLIDDILYITKDKFCFMLEIGESQAEQLDNYLYEKHQLKFNVLKDINGSDRNLLLEG